MRRRGEEGTDPEFKLVEHNHYDARYAEDYPGPGFSLHVKLTTWYRSQYHNAGVWKWSGRPRIKKTTIEVRRVLAITYSFWETTGVIYIRLWKIKNNVEQ